jgi:hypothetical protein
MRGLRNHQLSTLSDLFHGNFGSQLRNFRERSSTSRPSALVFIWNKKRMGRWKKVKCESCIPKRNYGRDPIVVVYQRLAFSFKMRGFLKEKKPAVDSARPARFSCRVRCWPWRDEPGTVMEGRVWLALGHRGTATYDVKICIMI